MKKKITIEKKELEIEIDPRFCKQVEQALLLPVFECKAISQKVYDMIQKTIKDWSNEKRPVSYEYRVWFEKSIDLATEIKKVDKDNKLNGIAYKKSEKGKYQLMPAWYYLTGVRKAFVNYIQTDFGLKSSKYEKEQAKKIALPKKMVTATTVEVTVKA